MADYSVILQSPTFRSLVQENALERIFGDGLYPKNLFRQEAVPESWAANVGDNKTFTGKGLMAVNLIPLIPGQDPQPSDYKLEQWTATMNQWGNSIDTNLPTAFVAAVNKLTEDMKTLGLNAGQTLNRLVRYKLFNAAEAGWTVADGAQTTVTTLRVKRLNGFTRVRRPDLTAGSQVRLDVVTANNPLPITVFRTVGGAAAVNVTGFTPDTPGDEIGPGTITIDSAVTVADRDAVIASTRTFHVQVGGGNSTDALTAGTDILHLADIRSAIARFRKMNVPECSDGTYHFHLDPIGETQLFADSELQQLTRGTAATQLQGAISYADFVINQLLGCTFYRNNENPAPDTVTGGTSATFSAADPLAGELFSNGNASTGSVVHRALAIGGEALREYYTDQRQLETEAGITGRVSQGARIVNNGVEIDVDRIRVIQRAPLDRLQQNVANTWSFMGDFVVRTDAATGDAANFKRVQAVLSTE